MSPRMLINAIELQVGDLWLGEDDSDVVIKVREVNCKPGEFIPWTKGKRNPTVPMTAVIIEGEFRMGEGTTFVGTWTLQEDQPLEIQRAE